jgi:hypothetical protein
MTATQQNAVLQEVLDQSYLYKQSAAIKNGLPDRPARNMVNQAPEPQVIEKRVEVEKIVDRPVEKLVTQTIEKETERSWLKDSLVGGAIATLGLGGGLALSSLLSGVESSPAPAPAVVAVEPSPAQKQYGELLKWLNQNGYNLPPTVTE